MALAIFIKNLRPSIKSIVAARQPATLSAAIEDAIAIEADIAHYDLGVSDPMTDLSQQLMVLSTQTRSDTQNRHCYSCGRVGHLARNCRDRYRESSRDRYRESRRSPYDNDCSRYHTPPRYNGSSSRDYRRHDYSPYRHDRRSSPYPQDRRPSPYRQDRHSSPHASRRYVYVSRSPSPYRRRSPSPYHHRRSSSEYHYRRDQYLRERTPSPGRCYRTLTPARPRMPALRFDEAKNGYTGYQD